MIKKTVVATLGALAVAGAAHAAGTAQMQRELNNLKMQVNQLQTSHTNTGGQVMGLVSTNANLSHMMLNHQSGVNKELSLLKARQHGHVANGLTIGGMIQADALWQHANKTVAVTGVVPGTSTPVTIHAGHLNPTMAGVSKKSASRINLTNVDLQFVAAINNWATAYVNFEHIIAPTYTTLEVGSGPSGPILARVASGFKHENVFNKAYLLIGNLNESPVYGLIGRNDINFGQFASVNPYSMPLNRVAFQANGEVAEIGVDAYGFNAAISAMNGGAHTGTTYSSNFGLGQNLMTIAGHQNINNFAFNAGYGMKTEGGLDFHLGAGLLRGSAFPSYTGKTNGAWDINANMHFANFELLGEFTDTFKKVTNKHAMAWQAAAAYHFPLMGHKTTASFGYSALNKGAAFAVNATDVSASQYVVGLRSDVLKHVSTGLEYAYNKQGDLKNSTVTLDVTAMF